ncbi:MAG: DUF1045 domain-containing protein [Desulfofustis sp.]|nr:DUF1045 domain-containing protein [Desulfofustis sp.]
MAGQPRSVDERLRLAVYFAPAPESALAGAARRWLGRAADDARPRGGLMVPGVPAQRLNHYRAAPFHYGFHATIKPPFYPRDGVAIKDVQDSLIGFCAAHSAIVLPPLQVAAIKDFLCLRPVGPCAEIDQLAADLVELLDPFRRPAGTAELARRRRASLSVRQEELLQRWGYPYLFDEFRFHLSLTGPVPDDQDREILQRFLEGHFTAALGAAVLVDRLSLFIEDDGQPLIQRFSCPLA